jgi:hypothetical protein
LEAVALRLMTLWDVVIVAIVDTLALNSRHLIICKVKHRGAAVPSDYILRAFL